MENTTKGRESTQVKTIRKLKTSKQDAGGGNAPADDVKRVEYEYEDDEEEGSIQKKLALNRTQAAKESEARAQLLEQDYEEQLSPKLRGKEPVPVADELLKELPTNNSMSPEKKLKRKIDVKEKQKFYGIKEDPFAYESEAGEYFNINMEQALAFVFNKSKTLKEKIERDFISNDFLKENLIDNKHFNLSYNSYLQRLCNKKLLSPDFKNVTKKTMQKLEKFFIERIDRCLESQKIQQAYIEKANYIQECFDKRIAELREKIKQKNKLGTLPQQ